jgi:hypothetical protein
MSTTLTLIDAGWEMVLALAARGQKSDAFAQLARLLARPDVPTSLAVEGNRLAGELALDLEKYATARRHLKIAATLEPTHAGTQYILGRAWEEDPDGCDRRSAICFKKAVALDTATPLYRVAFGRAAARCGKLKLGTREMLAAVESAKDNLEVIRVAVTGLLEVGKVNHAQQVIAKARFLCPGNAELALLWERTKFESALLTQQQNGETVKMAKTQENTRYAQDAHFATEGDRVILPFVRPVGTNENESPSGSSRRTVRRDAASFPRPHIARLRARKADC